MRCLCCGKEIKEKGLSNGGWHTACIKRFFGTATLPDIDISTEELETLAKETVDQGLTVPGVQKKLSLHLSQEAGIRLTLVDYPTGYILKPQTEDFEHLPEAEDLVMHMAAVVGIAAVPHALITLKNATYAYITKRIDRNITSKVINMYAMEDFCQLAGRLTEDKYRGSYELCAKILSKWSSQPRLDMTELFLRIVFFYVTGNSDMHLKNFSLIENAPGSREFILSPAYDMLPVNLVMPEDTEQLALTLNGKKRNLRRNDLLKYAECCGINSVTAARLIDKILSLREPLIEQCERSYLPDAMKEGMIELMVNRMEHITKK